MSEIIKMSESEQIKWFLEELSLAEEIDCDEIEIHGEDESGREGICEVKIQDIASRALVLIKSIEGTAFINIQNKSE